MRYLVLGLLALLFLDLLFLFGCFGGPFNALQDIGHGPAAVGTEDLDGNDLGLLGDTVGLGSDRASNMSPMTIAIFILVADRDGSAPDSAAVKLFMFDVDTSVDNISCDYQRTHPKQAGWAVPVTPSPPRAS
jgi:hypothetical protein